MCSKYKEIAKKIWKFIWEDNSIWSWLVNIILAFVIIKYIVYPGLGLLLGTNYPIVAVVSESMEHNGKVFDQWWSENGNWYIQQNISKEDFNKFVFRNGFNKGDLIILVGTKPSELKIGDVIVYSVNGLYGRTDPIIHRIVNKWEDENKEFHFQTKGDNVHIIQYFERDIKENQVIGKGVFKIPFLGYIKIFFVELIQIFR